MKRVQRLLIGTGALALLGLLVAPMASAQVDRDTTRPNFLVVLIDDAAFMDLSAYGGEARTPHIDALAARGSLFTNYHTSPLCAPTRAMLLTGLDNHLTGVATIPEVLPPEHVGQPGYSMRLEPGVTTVASRLSQAGYRTYMAGKWHLGHGEGDLPSDHGFDRTFILDASGADNWEQRAYMPYYATADWFEDGAPARLPDDFYSSEFLVDQIMGYLEDSESSDDPFFAYLAFQAIHIPIQAPREFTEHYRALYQMGWDELRVARWERARAMGFIPDDAALGDMPGDVRPWDSLTDEERALYAESMAVNAGMLEAMDHHLGRLIDYLEANGTLENTIIILASDNGPEPNHPVGMRGFGLWMAMNGYSQDLETLGERGTYAFIGTEWALAAASPFNLFKFYASEGGLRAPFIIAGPGVSQGVRVDTPAYVTDITPTMLDFGGVAAPADQFTGRSLRAVLAGEAASAYGADDSVGMEVSGNAALYRGSWKLARNLPPWGDGTWHLYDLSLDPGETNNIAGDHPEILASLRADYESYATANGVLELPAGYDPLAQVATNTLARVHARYMWLYITAAVLALALVGIIGRIGWRIFAR